MARYKLWLALVLPCLAFAQQEEAEHEPGLRLLPAEQTASLQRVFVSEANGTDDAARESWSRRLAVPDLDLREASLDELTLRARRDDRLRLMLEEFAVDPAQPERAWTARMALRELNRDHMSRALPTMPSKGMQPGLARLVELQLELEDALLRVEDPHFGGWMENFHQDLNAILGRDLGGCAEESKRFSLEIAPDGVRCKLFECIDGEEVKQEFKADSFGELLKAHPELRAHVNGEGTERKGLSYVPEGSQILDPVPAVSNVPNRVDRLGIQTAPVAAERVKKLGLDEGQGLLVVRTLPGSLASILGVRRGDIVTELDSLKVFTGFDVRQALSQRDAKAELRVVVITSRGERKELIWKPEF